MTEEILPAIGPVTPAVIGWVDGFRVTRKWTFNPMESRDATHLQFTEKVEGSLYPAHRLHVYLTLADGTTTSSLLSPASGFNDGEYKVKVADLMDVIGAGIEIVEIAVMSPTSKLQYRVLIENVHMVDETPKQFYRETGVWF